MLSSMIVNIVSGAIAYIVTWTAARWMTSYSPDIPALAASLIVVISVVGYDIVKAIKEIGDKLGTKPRP